MSATLPTRGRSSRRRRTLVAVTGLAVAAISIVAWLLTGPGSSPRLSEPRAASASLGSGITVSPVPGARGASPQTEISFLGATTGELAGLSVTGAKSGAHKGKLVAYASARGASFVPSNAFTPGEQVTLTAPAARIHYTFSVSKPAPITGTAKPGPASPVSASNSFSFRSEPSLRTARVSVTKSSSGTAPGDIFLSPIATGLSSSDGQPGPLILDGSGNPVWQGSVPAGDVAMGLRPQTYHGKQVLTWWQGRISSLGYGLGEDVIVDSSYRRVATIAGGNGYRADLHELTLTSKGAAWITAYRPVYADLSAYGGPKSAELLASVVQEIDVATGRVMFEWDPADHLSLADSYVKPASGAPWDPFHLNSVDLGANGSVLISARNSSAIYEVDGRTGRINWNLGGKQSSFEMPANSRFWWQHDARYLANGQVSLFDDEAAPKKSDKSRGLILKLDSSRRTAAVAREYIHEGNVLAGSQGNMQVLPNGNVLVGWGAAPYYSEFDSSGRLLYDVRLPGTDESYRAYRAPWTGRPAAPPALALTAATNSTTVYASWNGATGVARWQVLAGQTPDSLSVVASAQRSGFETSITVPGTDRYFAVRAIGADGHVLATSVPKAR